MSPVVGFSYTQARALTRRACVLALATLAAAFILQFTAAPSASAAVKELIVDGTLVGGNAPTGSCTNHTCVDEYTFGTELPNHDGLTTYLKRGPYSGGADVQEFSVTNLDGVLQVTGIEVGARGNCDFAGTAGPLRVQAFRDVAGTDVVVTPQGSATMNSGGSSWNLVSANATGLALTEAELDAVFIRVTMVKCPQFPAGTDMRLTSTSIRVTYTPKPRVQGIARDAAGAVWTAGCNGTTDRVAVAVNGTVHDRVPCDGSGAFTAYLDPLPAVGDVVTAFLDDGAVGTDDGAAYTRAASTTADITGLNVQVGQVRLASESASTITNANINQYDSTQEPQIPISSDGTNLTSTATQVIVNAGDTYAPGGNVTLPRLWIASTATLTGGTGTLELSGGGTGACTAGAVARPLCVDGTFTAPATTRYTASTNYYVQGATYALLQLQPASGAPTARLGHVAAAAIDATSVTIGGGVGTVTASTTSFNPALTVTGALAVGAGGTLAGSGSGTISVAGNVTGAGIINLTAGRFEHRVPLTGAQLDATAAPWTFSTYEASTSALTIPPTITIAPTSRAIAAARLEVGRVGDSQVTTLQAGGMANGITVIADLDITTRGALAAPPALTLQRNFTNNGTFTHNSGTVRLTNAANAATLDYGAPTTFSRLDVTTPGKVVNVEAGSTTNVTGQLNLTGTCGNEVSLVSTSLGAPWNINASGPRSVTSAAIRDSTSTTAITTTSSGDLGGNNANWNFAATTCAAPTSLFVDEVSAVSGSANATRIQGASAFHMSLLNALPVVADRHHTRVSTTPLDDALALWHLDGGGADSAAPSNVLTAPSGPTTPAFVPGPIVGAQAADFDGVDDRGEAVTNAAYADATYTVEAWVRTSALAPGTAPIVVSRGTGPANRHFELGFDEASGQLRGSASVGGTPVVATTAAASVVDGTWHHLALSATGSELRLIVDGAQRAATPYVGTVATPAATTYVGGTPVAGTHLDGTIADVRLSSRPLDAAAVAGYLATKALHGVVVWETGIGSGSTFSVPCAVGLRCDDVTYGGTALQQEGARWYVEQRLRTANSVWTRWSTPDWFETGSEITIDAIAPVTMPPAATGTDVVGTTTITTNCGELGGCVVLASAPSGTVALDNGGAGIIPPFARIQPLAPGPWAPGVVGGFGISVASSTTPKDTDLWGTGTLASHTGTLKYAGLDPTPIPLVTSSGPGLEVTQLATRMNVASGTTAGSYSGAIVITALPAP